MAQEDYPSGSDFAQGVGGRLSVPKSDSYVAAVTRIEARANPFVARYMLASDLAYVLSAVDIGVTPADEGRQLVCCLLDLLNDVDQLATAASVGDIVTQREAWVIERVGRMVGSRLHVGRNRGESIRGYLPRLFFRHVLHIERRELLRLIRVLHTKAGPVRRAHAPVYHHLQHAGITTLGEYLLSWASNLYPHMERLEQAESRLDIAPPMMTARRELVQLGDAVRKRLGFSRIAPLRQQIHVTEDQFAEPFFALVLTSVALSRLAEDLRIWMSSEFGFFNLADAHASGSSLLPQKKNPFGLQAVIGGAALGVGRLAAQLATNVSPSEELDSVFHAGSLYQHALDIVTWTRFMADVIELGQFDLKALARKASEGYAGTSEALDKLVYEAGVPLRIAHHELGAVVRALLAGREAPDLQGRLEAVLGRPVVIDNSEVMALIRGDDVPETSLALPQVDATWDKLAKILGRDDAQHAETSAVDAALDALVEGARHWLAGKPAGM